MTEDYFEQSLRDMLKTQESLGDDDISLDRVLRKANRQQGAGAIFSVFGRALESVMIGLNSGSEHVKPVSNLSNKNTANKAD